jgi:hypothetical protein
VSSKTVYDAAGNSITRSVSALIDTHAPVIADLGAVPPNGTNGWYTTAVTNNFGVTETLSGLASGYSDPFAVSSGAAEGSAVMIASGTVFDKAGNESTSINSAAFKIDLSDPTNVAFVGGPAAQDYYYGNVPAAPTCTADDAISGVATCAVTGYSTEIGGHTLTATATDNAGRTTTATRSYTVLAWSLSGFYQPVDMSGVYNTVKGGSTVPLKFEIFAGNEITDTAAVKSFTQAKITCNAAALTDDVEVTTTGQTSLRYDTTGGQFVQNWKTPTGAGTCYRVTMTTQDSSTLTAYFKLK